MGGHWGAGRKRYFWPVTARFYLSGYIATARDIFLHPVYRYFWRGIFSYFACFAMIITGLKNLIKSLGHCYRNARKHFCRL